MRCTNCGNEITDGSKFCPFCGAEMNTAPKAPKAPKAPAAPSSYNHAQNSNAYTQADTGKVLEQMRKRQAREAEYTTFWGWLKLHVKFYTIIILAVALCGAIYIGGKTLIHTTGQKVQQMTDEHRADTGKSIDIVTPFQQYIVFSGPDGEGTAKIVLPDDFDGFTLENGGIYAKANPRGAGFVDIIKDNEKLGTCFVTVSPYEQLSEGDTVDLHIVQMSNQMDKNEFEKLQEKLNESDISLYPLSVEITVPELASQSDFSEELLKENLESIIKNLDGYSEVLGIYYGTAKPGVATEYKTVVIAITGMSKTNRKVNWIEQYRDPYLENGVLKSLHHQSGGGKYDYEADIYTNDDYDLVRIY
ncbi:MAG: zinc ribbon domain-containing protein [Solobacterium sp.]|nr:zinc ribbon domain-containing protein [Solobacterium sp.]